MQRVPAALCVRLVQPCIARFSVGFLFRPFCLRTRQSSQINDTLAFMQAALNSEISHQAKQSRLSQSRFGIRYCRCIFFFAF